MVKKTFKTNILKNNRAVLKFNRLPELEFYAKSMTIPGISLNTLQRDTIVASTRHAGSKINFEETFSVMFLVDEDMLTYSALYDWIVAFGIPDDIKQLKNYEKDHTLTTTSTVFINNLHDNPILKLDFYGVFPVGLSGIDLQFSTNSPQILTADATFAYTEYKMSKVE